MARSTYESIVPEIFLWHWPTKMTKPANTHMAVETEPRTLEDMRLLEDRIYHFNFQKWSSRWLGIGDLIAEPEGPSFISSTVARRRVDRPHS